MELPSAEQLTLLPLWYVAFLLAVTCHEAAHAACAWLGGDPTAYSGGQASLNPLPHIQREPLGTIVAPLLTFVLFGWTMGWASAPYDPIWEERYPRRAALMALGGPLANLVLAAISFAVLKIGLLSGWWTRAYDLGFDNLVRLSDDAPAFLLGVGMFASVSLLLNCALFLFNLFPVPPLDGAGVIAGLGEWGRVLREKMRSSLGFMGLLLAWALFGRLFPPFYSVVLSWLV